MKNEDSGCVGYCRQCGCDHHLSGAPARGACLDLMAKLKQENRIDFTIPAGLADPRYSTDYLEGPARGKMFGVMIARTASGETQVLRAFSGQYNGSWQVPGWVGPVFEPAEFYHLHDPRERAIKELGRQMEEKDKGTSRYQSLAVQRKEKSRQLMKMIHGLYRLKNFCSQEAGLQEIFFQGKGIPTGTGDCCAPKLLQHAALNDLRPLGLAEFYWGRQNSSGSRQHGRFYPSCRSKCYPLLGFMLCGLQGIENG